ncbi:MAG: DNA polymerase [bacterium]
MSKYIYLDFEYCHPAEKSVDTVCCSWKKSDNDTLHHMWLYKNKKAKTSLAKIFYQYKEKRYIFVSYAVTAEARAFIDIGLDPTMFKWVDLYVEWRQLRNCCDQFNYGRYYLKGMRRRSVPPSVNKADNVGRDNNMLGFGLTDCVARLLKINIDKDLKHAMRDLILSAPEQFTQEEVDDILEYCDKDIVYLPEIHYIMHQEMSARVQYTKPSLQKVQIKRGAFSADVAKMENEGIPIDMEAITNLRKNVALAKDKLIRDLVEKHYPFFIEKKKRKTDLKGRWVDTYKQFESFIKADPRITASKWKRTDSGRFCTDDQYLKKFEGIPEIKAYRETRQILGQLKWLREPEGTTPDLMDNIGSDGRMRTFFGIFGTQTARNAPSAKKFILAMSAWLRCLIRPPKEYRIVELDYGSQEFAIAAILSKDKSMMDAYNSGDPYLYFAKKAGAVPKDGTKDRYKKERNLFKSTTLGLQYGMGVKALANKLSVDTGSTVIQEQAQVLISKHKNIYPTYWRWLSRIDRKYIRNKYLKLPCGWALLADNPNTLSVRNFPTQGAGSSVIREAVRRCHKKNIVTIATLHDSIYILAKEESWQNQADATTKIMFEAFNEVLNVTSDDINIRIDVDSHSHEETWVSEKGAAHYEILKEYLRLKKTREDRIKELMKTIYN